MATESLTTVLRVVGAAQVIRELNGVAHAATGIGRASSFADATAKGLHLVAVSMKAVAVAGASATGVIAGFGLASVKATASLQNMQLQLNTLYGTAARGKKAFDWALKMEAKTPFTLSDVVGFQAAMKAFRLDPERNMQTLLDAVAAFGGGGEMMDRTISALGKSMSRGKITMEGLEDQPMLMGLIMDLARKMYPKSFQSGKGVDIGAMGIPAAPFINALLNEMDKRFGGTSQAQAGTIGGRWSTLMSSVQKVMYSVGNVLAPAVSKFIEKAIKVLDSEWFRLGVARLYAILVQLLSVSKIGTSWLQKVLKFDWLFAFARSVVDFYYGLKVGFIMIRYALGEIFDYMKWFGLALIATILKVGAAIEHGINSSVWGNKQQGSLGKSFDAARLAANAANPNGLIARAANAAAFGLEAGRAMRGQSNAYAYLSEVQKKAEEMLANLDLSPKVPGIGKGRGANRPESIGAIARTVDLVDQIILGGGTRAQRGVRGTAMGRLAPPAPKPIKVTVDAGQGPLGQAFSALMETMFGQMWVQMMQDPQTRQMIAQMVGGR